MALAARLLSPIAGTRWCARPGSVATRSFLALGAVEALGQVADRGLKRFYLRLQGRFALQEPRVLRPPVVRLPLELNIGLLRQYHALLRKRGDVVAVTRRQIRDGADMGVGALHGVRYTRFFWNVLVFSDRSSPLCF